MSHPTAISPEEQEQMARRIGVLLLQGIPEDWQQVAVEYRAAGEYHDLLGEVTRQDGTEQWEPPEELLGIFEYLREGMYRPDVGTWLSALYIVERPSSYRIDINFDEEPQWQQPLPRAAYADELRRYPRSDDNIPDWMRERLNDSPASSAVSPVDGEHPGTASPGAVPPAAPAPGPGDFVTAHVFDGIDEQGRPLVDGRDPALPEEAAALRQYLENAPIVLAARENETDELDPQGPAVVPGTWHTDGTWVWPGSVAYYLAQYGLPPEPALVQHARAQGFRVTQVDDRVRDAAAATLAMRPEDESAFASEEPVVGDAETSASNETTVLHQVRPPVEDAASAGLGTVYFDGGYPLAAEEGYSAAEPAPAEQAEQADDIDGRALFAPALDALPDEPGDRPESADSTEEFTSGDGFALEDTFEEHDDLGKEHDNLGEKQEAGDFDLGEPLDGGFHDEGQPLDGGHEEHTTFLPTGRVQEAPGAELVEEHDDAPVEDEDESPGSDSFAGPARTRHKRTDDDDEADTTDSEEVFADLRVRLDGYGIAPDEYLIGEPADEKWSLADEGSDWIVAGPGNAGRPVHFARPEQAAAYLLGSLLLSQEQEQEEPGENLPPEPAQPAEEAETAEDSERDTPALADLPSLRAAEPAEEADRTGGNFLFTSTEARGEPAGHSDAADEDEQEPAAPTRFSPVAGQPPRIPPPAAPVTNGAPPPGQMPPPLPKRPPRANPAANGHPPAGPPASPPPANPGQQRPAPGGAGVGGPARPGPATGPPAGGPARPQQPAVPNGPAGQPGGEQPIQPLQGEPPLTLYRDRGNVVLQPGTDLDRFGEPGGNVTYAMHTPYNQRSLPPQWASRAYFAYRVQRPVRALRCTAVPWFEQPGGGTAYVLPASVNDLVADGTLIALSGAEAPPRPPME